MLGEKMKKHEVRVWLINTGWSGGAYGTGERIKLAYTRAMITAALHGELEDIAYRQTPYFQLRVPVACPGVPAEILYPQDTWPNAQLFDEKAKALALEFIKNFEKYASGVSAEVLAAAPVLLSESA
jgi:phosphoenolpyruvate carboxykinase (ATP)